MQVGLGPEQGPKPSRYGGFLVSTILLWGLIKFFFLPGPLLLWIQPLAIMMWRRQGATKQSLQRRSPTFCPWTCSGNASLTVSLFPCILHDMACKFDGNLSFFLFSSWLFILTSFNWCLQMMWDPQGDSLCEDREAPIYVPLSLVTTNVPRDGCATSMVSIVWGCYLRH